MAWLATRVVEAALVHLGRNERASGARSSGLVIAGTASVLAGSSTRWRFSRAQASARSRAATSSRRASTPPSARDWAYLTFGWGAAALLVAGLRRFRHGERRGGRQDLLLSAAHRRESGRWSSKAFWNNIFIFVIAEILVLVWGLDRRHRAADAGPGRPAGPHAGDRSIAMCSAACRPS